MLGSRQRVWGEGRVRELVSAATAISVRGLGKTYRIAHASDRPTRATEAIVARLRHPLRRTTFDRFERSPR